MAHTRICGWPGKGQPRFDAGLHHLLPEQLCTRLSAVLYLERYTQMGATTVVCFTEKMGVSLQPLKVKKKILKTKQTPKPQKAEIKPELPPALLASQDSQVRRPGSRSAHDRRQWILPRNGQEGSGRPGCLGIGGCFIPSCSHNGHRPHSPKTSKPGAHSLSPTKRIQRHHHQGSPRPMALMSSISHHC